MRKLKLKVRCVEQLPRVLLQVYAATIVIYLRPLSGLSWLASYLILSYLILSYLILSYLILSYLILSYLIRPKLVGIKKK
eukprot:SAG31_NODE_9487_length_1269_cov_1.582906_1_plen_79_part_10